MNKVRCIKHGLYGSGICPGLKIYFCYGKDIKERLRTRFRDHDIRKIGLWEIQLVLFSMKGDGHHENMNGKFFVFTIREPEGSPASRNSKKYV